MAKCTVMDRCTTSGDVMSYLNPLGSYKGIRKVSQTNYKLSRADLDIYSNFVASTEMLTIVMLVTGQPVTFAMFLVCPQGLAELSILKMLVM